jgi:hypothetical protein
MAADLKLVATRHSDQHYMLVLTSERDYYFPTDYLVDAFVDAVKSHWNI